VKTRLAATIGGAAANQLYRELAERQLAVIPSHWRFEVCYAPHGARREMVAWLGRRTRLRLQEGNDLGARLTTAFRTTFERGSKRVLAIGADCPDLDASCLNAAANALDDCDTVLGPAKDGGYYLIGMRRNLPRLFEDIAWSSSTVLRATIERARESKASVRLLVETDSPFLSPPGAPRGRNEPEWVRITAAWVASQRDETNEAFGDGLVAAYERIFQWRTKNG
jgi:hypothetical protein